MIVSLIEKQRVAVVRERGGIVSTNRLWLLQGFNWLSLVDWLCLDGSTRVSLVLGIERRISSACALGSLAYSFHPLLHYLYLGGI